MDETILIKKLLQFVKEMKEILAKNIPTEVHKEASDLDDILYHVIDDSNTDPMLQTLYNEKKNTSLSKSVHDKIDHVINLRKQELELELEREHQATQGKQP